MEWTVRERLHLAVAVALACVRRLEALTLRANPEDTALLSLVDALSRRALERVEHLERYQSGLRSREISRWTRKEMDDVIRQQFPSLSWPLGGGRVARREGTYLAECLENECSRFLQSLAECSSESEARAFFQGLGKQDLASVDVVRHVLRG